MEKEDFYLLIQKYLQGECNGEEIQTINKWYQSFEKEEGFVSTLSAQQRAQLEHRLLHRIRTNITSPDEMVQYSAKPILSRRLLYSLSGLAAMIIMALSLFFFNHSEKNLPASENIEVANLTQSIQKVMLADGSIVWLNPKSKLKYPRKFIRSTRTVQIEGEAFFEVARDISRPFIIHSNKVVTKVLGTSFRIRAYRRIPVQVSVLTGKVSVSLEDNEASEVMLLPAQKATYHDRNNSLKKEQEQQSSDIRIWKKSNLSFDDEPLKEIINELNKLYDVHISSDNDQLLNYSLKADFTQENLASILEMLKKTLRLEYEIQGREIILKAKTN